MPISGSRFSNGMDRLCAATRACSVSTLAHRTCVSDPVEVAGQVDVGADFGCHEPILRPQQPVEVNPGWDAGLGPPGRDHHRLINHGLPVDDVRLHAVDEPTLEGQLGIVRGLFTNSAMG